MITQAMIDAGIDACLLNEEEDYTGAFVTAIYKAMEQVRTLPMSHIRHVSGRIFEYVGTDD